MNPDDEVPMPTAPLLPRSRIALSTTFSLLAALALTADAAAQRPAPTVAVSVPGAPAGSEVTVRIGGLTPGLRLQLGFGGLSSNHEILGNGEADTEGNFQMAVKIPDWVERHRVYHFFVAYAGQPPRTVSDPFIATAADGFVRVAGSVSSTASGCAQVRGFDDTVYTLLGETGALQAGARVVVEGTVGGVGAATPPAASAGGCAAGPQIPVQVRQVLPG
jgi:hypothetical protein